MLRFALLSLAMISAAQSFALTCGEVIPPVIGTSAATSLDARWIELKAQAVPGTISVLGCPKDVVFGDLRVGTLVNVADGQCGYSNGTKKEVNCKP